MGCCCNGYSGCCSTFLAWFALICTKSLGLQMKSKLSKHDLLFLYGAAWLLGSTIVVLITMILSTFYNYRITIVTNDFSECYIEIVGITTGIIIFVYELIRRFRLPTN